MQQAKQRTKQFGNEVSVLLASIQQISRVLCCCRQLTRASRVSEEHRLFSWSSARSGRWMIRSHTERARDADSSDGTLGAWHRGLSARCTRCCSSPKRRVSGAMERARDAVASGGMLGGWHCGLLAYCMRCCSSLENHITGFFRGAALEAVDG